jgi:pSer/pThr/pTyr-binding forkhead associated (FHA) protein
MRQQSEQAEGAMVPVPSGACVRVTHGFYEGLELPVDRDWFVIGRGRAADAIVPEPTISRAHAAIGWQADEGFFVQDLGSTNGTMVNGDRQKHHVLESGDEIQMGKLRLRIQLPSDQ